MKPIWLKLNAWGPYAKAAEIDLQAVSRNGLFLITGSTGAGKTTIFDGIAFALYGEVSGEIRNSNTVRSDFAPPEEETFVELHFVHQNIKYELYRSPRYQRLKKRGEGMILKNETAHLKKEGGLIASGNREVTERIQKLLGINYTQFKQISMIAQGEFQKFLTANSKERTEIFRSIFQTKIYENITKVLSVRSRTLCQEIEQYTKTITEAVSLLQGIEKEGMTIEEIIKEVKEKGKELEISYQEKKEKQESYEQELQRKAIWLEQEKKQQERRKILAAQRKELDVFLIQWEESEKKQENYRELEREIQKKKRELEEQKLSLPIFEQYEEMVKKFRKMEKEEQQLEESLKKIQIQEMEEQKELKQIQEQQSKLENIEQEQAELFIQKRENQLEREELIKIENQRNELRQAEKELEKRKKIYQKAERESQIARQEWEQVQLQYRQATAGVLAKDLAEGMPCPVCGSLHHPKKALSEEVLLSEEEREKKKSAYQSMEEEREKLYQRVMSFLGEVAQRKEQLKTSFSLEEIEEKKKENIEQKQRLEQEEAVLKKKREEKIRLSKRWDIIQNSQREYQEEIRKIKEQYQTWIQEKSVISGRKEILKEQLPKEYISKQELEAVLKQKQQQIQMQENNWKQYQEEQRELQIAIDTRKAILIDLEKELGEETDLKEENFIIELEKELQLLKEEKEKIQRKLEEEKSQIYHNHHICILLEEKQKKKKILEKEYGIIHDIELVLKGNNPKNIIFEQYVLSVYFEEIIKAANLRLLPMTEERYQIYQADIITDARKKDGLEMEVLDFYTGKRRPIRSLSGGELFKAALSLALGISEVIQNYAGGIELEALFIDEGFGALDSQSLDQALEALLSLTKTKRMIGIISHISELKERITNKIVVVKTSQGSEIGVKYE